MPEMRDMLEPDVLAALDAYIAAQAVTQTESDSRPKAVNDILRDWFVGHGLMPHADEAEGE